MSQRTSTGAVQTLLGGDYDTIGAPSLQPFVDTASVIVDRLATAALALEVPITLLDTELELIERWLSAHAYCLNDPQYQSKSTGGASGSFTGQTGQGFELTRYGQMAMRLDYSGQLTALDKRQRARLVWLGKPPSTQINVNDRS